MLIILLFCGVYLVCLCAYLLYSFFLEKFVVRMYDWYMLGFVWDFKKIVFVSHLMELILIF